jgi:hypothetical protein
MPQIMGVIENAAPRATASGTIYDVFIGGQKYSTFDAAHYRQAAERISQTVTAEVEMKPSKDGQFMNYYFNGVVGADGNMPGVLGQPPQPMAQTPQPMVQVPQPVVMQAPAAQQIPMQPPPLPQYQRDMSPEAIARITKLSCLQSANNFVGQLWQGSGPEAMEAAEKEVMAYAKRMYAQVLGPPQTLDDEVVQQLVQPAPEGEQGEIEDW